MAKPILLLGAADELELLARKTNFKVVKIVEIDPSKKSNIAPVIMETPTVLRQETIKHLLMGFDSPDRKEKLYKFYRLLGFEFVSAIVGSSDSDLENSEGLIMQHSTFVSTNCKLGRCIKLNVGCTIMHDASIGDFCTIAPRATLLGRVTLENNVFVGANSTILPDIKVGNNSIIGAGAVVTKNVPANMIARGVPARFYSNKPQKK